MCGTYNNVDTKKLTELFYSLRLILIIVLNFSMLIKKNIYDVWPYNNVDTKKLTEFFYSLRLILIIALFFYVN